MTTINARVLRSYTTSKPVEEAIYAYEAWLENVLTGHEYWTTITCWAIGQRLHNVTMLTLEQFVEIYTLSDGDIADLAEAMA